MATVLILVDERGRRHAVSVDRGMARVPGVGTFEADRLRSQVGHRLVIGERSFFVLTPSLRDLWETIERGPQALVPKDIGALLFEIGVGAGSLVVEAGAGSGALTMVLASAVRPSGRVTAYDLRADALRLAKTNVERAGLMPFVDFRHADFRDRAQEVNVDAVVLDIPDSWSAIPRAWETLRPCGHLASFSPNMEQVKETVVAIRARPFVDVRTIELIEREMEVREKGVRPSFAPLGHTGYLTFARKVFDTF